MQVAEGGFTWLAEAEKARRCIAPKSCLEAIMMWVLTSYSDRVNLGYRR